MGCTTDEVNYIIQAKTYQRTVLRRHHGNIQGISFSSWTNNKQHTEISPEKPGI